MTLKAIQERLFIILSYYYIYIGRRTIPVQSSLQGIRADMKIQKMNSIYGGERIDIKSDRIERGDIFWRS